MRTADTHPVRHSVLASASAIAEVLVMSFTPHRRPVGGAAAIV
jgi:hypothetical protein